MNKRQFEQILKSGEGAMVEFKQAVSSSLGREICALANTAGGRIFIGVDDKNAVTGCKLTNQVKSRVQDIANNFDIFHRLQLIEKVGTGVQRIIAAIQARKLSIEFYFGSFFSITFFRPVLTGYPKDTPGLAPDKIAKIPLEKVEEDIAETGQEPDKNRTSFERRPDKIAKSPLEKTKADITDAAYRKYPASIQQALNKFGWTWDRFNGFVPGLSHVCPKTVPCTTIF
jgi:hypothetical protein